MTRIDRYILFIYMRVLFICFMSMAGLLIVVHVFSNLDEFIEYGRSKGSIVRGIVEYCGPYLLSVFDRTAGILALMAAMFVIAWLYRTNELTAILAAGISKGRVVRPILIASIVLMIGATINRELFIPQFAETLGKNPKDLTQQREMPMRPLLDHDRNCLIGGRHIFLVSKEIGEPMFRLSGASAAFSKQVTGRIAKFQEAHEGRPQGFLVEDVRIPAGVSNLNSVYLEGVPYVLSPKDTPWLQPNQCFITSTIHFELLQGGSNWKQYSSTYNLIGRLRSDPRYYGNDIRATVHSRFMRPFMDLGLVLFGLPIVLGRQERHLFWVAGTSIFLVAGYLAILMGSIAIGASGSVVSPSLAAWIPVVAFLPFAWVRTAQAMES